MPLLQNDIVHRSYYRMNDAATTDEAAVVKEGGIRDNYEAGSI